MMLRPGIWLTIPILLAFVIIIVNMLLIIVICRTPSLQTVSNMYITSLAVVDMLVGICLLAHASVFVTFVKDHLPETYQQTCLLVISFSLSTGLMSMLHLMIISIDRCLCIRWPFFYLKRNNASNALAVILCIWIFGIVYMALPNMMTARTMSECDITMALPVVYVVYLSAPIYLTSLLVTIIMYALVLHTALQHRKMINRLVPTPIRDRESADAELNRWPEENFDGEVPSRISLTKLCALMNDLSSPRKEDDLTTRTPENSPVADMTEAEIKNRQSYPYTHLSDFNTARKNAKFFATVFGVYFVLITPGNVCMTIDYYVTVNHILYDIMGMLALSNSAANFFIFYSINSAFRNALHETLRGRRPD